MPAHQCTSAVCVLGAAAEASYETEHERTLLWPVPLYHASDGSCAQLSQHLASACRRVGQPIRHQRRGCHKRHAAGVDRSALRRRCNGAQRGAQLLLGGRGHWQHGRTGRQPHHSVQVHPRQRHLGQRERLRRGRVACRARRERPRGEELERHALRGSGGQRAQGVRSLWCRPCSAIAAAAAAAWPLLTARCANGTSPPSSITCPSAGAGMCVPRVAPPIASSPIRAKPSAAAASSVECASDATIACPLASRARSRDAGPPGAPPWEAVGVCSSTAPGMENRVSAGSVRWVCSGAQPAATSRWYCIA